MEASSSEIAGSAAALRLRKAKVPRHNPPISKRLLGGAHLCPCCSKELETHISGITAH